MTRVSSRAPSSLFCASLDIGRALADRGGLTLRARGACMYPTVRPNDVLRVRTCLARDAAVGDIALCRTPEHLFAHRVLDVGERDGRAYIVTCADRFRAGVDPPTFDDDLLGVVVSIERAGRSVPLQPTAYSLPLRLYHRVRLIVLEAEPRARLLADALMSRMQERASYGWAARRWYARRGPALRFVVRAPAYASLGDAVSRELAPSAFDPEQEWHGRRLDRWTLVAKVGDSREPAASLTYARDAAGAWRPEESTVRVRYRGSGLEEALARQAEEILGRSRGA